MKTSRRKDIAIFILCVLVAIPFAWLIPKPATGIRCELVPAETRKGETVIHLVEEIKEEELVDRVKLEILACVIYQEAGGDDVCDETRYMVGDVVLNRVDDERFPDTMEEVLLQKRQFGEYFWTGITWLDRSKSPGEADAVQRAYDTARDLLTGKHSDIYGKGYIWEAEFPQGEDVIYLDGLYFGR